ncbi:hypothetical protein ACQP2X_36180 [Actinoplanes sp. CA-131856]
MKMPRPKIVVAACGMLAAGGVLFAGEVMLSADKYFTDMRTYERAVRDGIVENDTAFAAVGVTIHLAMAAVGVLAGVALVVLALAAFGGRDWARAVAWFFGLPVLIWYGILAVLYFMAGLFGGGEARTELGPRFDEAWPPWLDALDAGLMVAVSVLLVGALVGQTVPAADAYYRSAGAGRGPAPAYLSGPGDFDVVDGGLDQGRG